MCRQNALKRETKPPKDHEKANQNTNQKACPSFVGLALDGDIAAGLFVGNGLSGSVVSRGIIGRGISNRLLSLAATSRLSRLLYGRRRIIGVACGVVAVQFEQLTAGRVVRGASRTNRPVSSSLRELLEVDLCCVRWMLVSHSRDIVDMRVGVQMFAYLAVD